MAAVPYILAADFKEAHEFARDVLGLGKGHFYIVTSAAAIKGPRGADLHIAPGWERRHDRFVIESALRWTKLNKIDHTAEGPKVTIEQHSASRGEQQNEALSPDAASSTDNDLDPKQYEMITPEEVADFIAVNEEAVEAFRNAITGGQVKKRRSSKCKVCKTMITPEERDSGMHDHTQDLVSAT